ncbi:interleukin-1 beta-like [Mixophyes fleayi]|uniref:interleukin-1 beta-like n=1 Tax=Mixophyes fleayi TaxID=3061075 RepID=UPI003F4E07B7
MDYYQLETNICDMSGWIVPPIITYSTPPYISLREDIGPLPHPPPIRPRNLMDMVKKFDSREGRYEIQVTTQDAKEIYKKLSSFLSKIHDLRFKWMVYDPNTRKLSAKPLVGSNENLKATFEISNYVSMETNDGKKPTTLKIKSENLYLSCNQSGGLQLETIQNLDQIDESTKRFLFFRAGGTANTTFESAIAQGLYISTSEKGDSEVTVTSSTNPRQFFEFVMDDELYGSLLNIGFKRISLQPPRKQESFNHTRRLMTNTYDRFCL